MVQWRRAFAKISAAAIVPLHTRHLEHSMPTQVVVEVFRRHTAKRQQKTSNALLKREPAGQLFMRTSHRPFVNASRALGQRDMNAKRATRRDDRDRPPKPSQQHPAKILGLQMPRVNVLRVAALVLVARHDDT